MRAPRRRSTDQNGVGGF
uniref:Uncharacterized protein n=1 Tax=Arundo donax TaxID=35708 RepID=A0A0A9CBT0_ARUDO